jgi:hypothetical protein
MTYTKKNKQTQSMWENLFVVVTKKQLKDLTNMLCLWIPCQKLYNDGVFSYVFTWTQTCHFKMSTNKLNRKIK